jgi:exodeoxyribonuclease VII large subunit
LAKTLDGYSPAKKISSGYAYVENQKHQSIRSVTMIKPKDEITIHVTDGNVKAIVTEVSKNE